MKITSYNPFVFLLLALFAFACSNSKTTDDVQHEHEHSVSETTVSLSAEQIQSIQVQLGYIEKKQLSTSLKANGFLRVLNQNRATVTPLIGGVVQALYVQTGQRVKKGEPIVCIVNTEFISMQEKYLSLEAELELAQLEHKRQIELQAGQASALKALQTSKSELDALSAKVAGLQKQLQLIGINTAQLSSKNMQSSITILSPIAGSVSEIKVNLGSYADANHGIVEIIDHSQLHLDLYIYEKDLNKLQKGQIIHFTLTNNPGKEYDAEIYSIDNTFENETKAVAVHAAVKGDKTGLIDGMSITALVSLDNARLDAVPTEAIVNFQGQDYIFIVAGALKSAHSHGDSSHGHSHSPSSADPAGLTFERIPVRRGSTDVGYSEITLLKDIPAQAQIVTKGAFFILAKMTNQGEAHAH